MSNTQIHQSFLWIAILTLTVLFLIPEEYPTGGILDWWDKAQHVLAFGALMILGYFAYQRYLRTIAVGLVSYGLLIEIAQSSTGWRQGDMLDFVANGVGVLLASLIIQGYRYFKV